MVVCEERKEVKLLRNEYEVVLDGVSIRSCRHVEKRNFSALLVGVCCSVKKRRDLEED